jgi:hypothetical protein
MKSFKVNENADKPTPFSSGLASVFFIPISPSRTVFPGFAILIW